MEAPEIFVSEGGHFANTSTRSSQIEEGCIKGGGISVSVVRSTNFVHNVNMPLAG